MKAVQRVQFRRPPVVNHPARIVVDPNSADRDDPTLTVASLAEADRIPDEGDFVVVRQPDDDGSDFVGSAHVVHVDRIAGLAYLRVDWPSFREVPSARDIALVVVNGMRYHYTLHERTVAARPPLAGEFNTAGSSLRRATVGKVGAGS